VNKQDRQHAETAGETTWLYLLAGYVIGFVAAHMLVQYTPIGERTGALLGGLGLALSGRSLGSAWRTETGSKTK